MRPYYKLGLYIIVVWLIARVVFFVLFIGQDLYYSAQSQTRYDNYREGMFDFEHDRCSGGFKYSIFIFAEPKLRKNVELFTNRQDEIMSIAQSDFIAYFQSVKSIDSSRYVLLVGDVHNFFNQRYISAPLSASILKEDTVKVSQLYSLNYQIDSAKCLSNSDIIDTTFKPAVNKMLLANFNGANECKIIPTYDNVDVICFSDNDIIFIYKATTLQSNTQGNVEIRVPMNMIKFAFKLDIGSE